MTTKCTTKQDNHLIKLWEQVTKTCCNGADSDDDSELRHYYQMCQRCYERAAKACIMSAHVYRRAKLPHHASLCSKLSTLAQKKMRLADSYRRQIASLLSFGDNAIFHMDWHLARVCSLNTARDALITQQGMLEAEMQALLQVNAWEQPTTDDYYNEE
jgi:hypothetical protein